MTNANSGYISALEARDIKRYPNEIANIPNRGSVPGDMDRVVTFSETVADVAIETPSVPVTEPAASKAKADRPFTLWEKEAPGLVISSILSIRYRLLPLSRRYIET
jgi:hypothetical protein